MGKMRPTKLLQTTTNVIKLQIRKLRIEDLEFLRLHPIVGVDIEMDLKQKGQYL